MSGHVLGASEVAHGLRGPLSVRCTRAAAFLHLAVGEERATDRAELAAPAFQPTPTTSLPSARSP